MNMAMPDSEIYTTLTEIFRRLFQRDDISLSATTTSKDVQGWNSFKHVEIILAVEQHYGCRFTAQELDRMETCGDLARYIGVRQSRS
jgi:acyl carrier protein